MITATGIGSGLDIDGLVTQLVAAERQATDQRLVRNQIARQEELSALGTLKGSLSSLQSGLSGLSNLSSFNQNSITSSDTAAIAVSAGNDAIRGNYNVEVSQLATTESLASVAFADQDTTALGTGTLTIRRGTTDYDSGSDTYNSFTLNPDTEIVNITIDESNNTLEGIRDAINEADAGVNATIVNDGTGFRLLLNAEDTGRENSFEITVDDTTDGDNDDNAVGLSRFAFNSAATNLEQTIAAQDAQLTINGLAISSASNTISEVVSGVELTLNQVTESPVSVSIAEDRDAAVGAVNDFITAYNGFITTVNALSSFDPETNVSGPLLGDFTLRSVESQLGSILRGTVDGVSGEFSNLTQLGITTNSDGTLSLDTEQLNDALDTSVDDVTAVFAALGLTADSTVAYLSNSEATQVGNYDVEVTQLAASGFFAGSSVLPDFGGGGSVVINDDNDSFNISINGVDGGNISLTQGTYTSGTSLADELQAQINSVEAFSDAGITVTAGYDSVTNSLTITSDLVSSESTVAITAVDTNVAASLGFSVSNGTVGLNVQGTIGGVAATGIGNVLTAASGTGAEGLALEITGSTLGSRGSVNFTRGIGDQLDTLLESLLASDSALDSRTDSIESALDDLEEEFEAFNLRMEAVEARFRSQFNALDSLLLQLNSTSQFLTTQLAALPQPNSISNNS